MSLDVIAWSNLNPWSPALQRLEDLGLSASRSVIKVSQNEIEAGIWEEMEVGEYWTTNETAEHSFTVGSYSFWESLRVSIFKALEDEPGAIDGLRSLFNHNTIYGGWGPAACADILAALERLEPVVRERLDPHQWTLTERCWQELTEAFRLGSQGGAVLLS